MKAEAQKFQKILYFTKDARTRNLLTKTAESSTPDTKKGKSLDRHYPYNCISKYYPYANNCKITPRILGKELILPCGFEYGQSWGALRKCWKMYKYAHRIEDGEQMLEYAQKIQKLQTQLGIPTASFPNIGLLGDIFFLYDKQKEAELRRQYAFENIVCDKMGSTLDELKEDGTVKEFATTSELKHYMEKEHYEAVAEQMKIWAMSDKTQEYVKAVNRKWDRRNRLRQDIRKIKEELKNLRVGSVGRPNKELTEEQKRARRYKEFLRQQRILKESELSSVEAISLVKTDMGWKYAKEIILNNRRQQINYDYEPTYHLTDLSGRRLGNYKEEQQYVNDPYFYRLYLEDKEWEKIYAKEQES
jgi:hypothetical protein